jgi:nucleoid DNA-binding protein
MEQLINLVAQKAGISQEQAKHAVTTVTDFLKNKLPAGVNLDSILSGGGLGNLASGVGDIFGKK